MANINIKRYNGSSWELHYPKTTIGQVINLSTQLANMQSDIDGKEPAITKGTTSQYFRGDMSLATFPSMPTIPSILPINEGSEGITTTAHTVSSYNLVRIIENISPPGARTPLSHTLDSHSGTLSLTKGGTGSTTAPGARSNLGLTNVLRQVSFSGGTLTIEVI